jgi:hypothetical protein
MTHGYIMAGAIIPRFKASTKEKGEKKKRKKKKEKRKLPRIRVLRVNWLRR